MVKYIGILIRRYVPCFKYMTFLHSDFMRVLSCLHNSAYPSSYGFTGSIESTTSQMSSLSSRNADNTRSVTLL